MLRSGYEEIADQVTIRIDPAVNTEVMTAEQNPFHQGSYQHQEELGETEEAVTQTTWLSTLLSIMSIPSRVVYGLADRLAETVAADLAYDYVIEPTLGYFSKSAEKKAETEEAGYEEKISLMSSSHPKDVESPLSLKYGTDQSPAWTLFEEENIRIVQKVEAVAKRDNLDSRLQKKLHQLFRDNRSYPNPRLGKSDFDRVASETHSISSKNFKPLTEEEDKALHEEVMKLLIKTTNMIKTLNNPTKSSGWEFSSYLPKISIFGKIGKKKHLEPIRILTGTVKMAVEACTKSRKAKLP